MPEPRGEPTNIPEEPMPEAREPKVDIELPPEVIEKIMAKVQNITEYGTAYTSMGLGLTDDERYRTQQCIETAESRLTNVLNKGLLGIPWGNRHNYEQHRSEPSGESLAELWKQDIKGAKKGVVHFNIIGRTLAAVSSHDLSKFKMENKAGVEGKPYPRARGFASWAGFPQLIFDISKFKELEPNFETGYDTERKPRTYEIVATKELVDFTPDEKGKVGVSPEYGFQLSSRVAPRLFHGIIIENAEDKDVILEVMNGCYHDDPEKMLPIYQVVRDEGFSWSEDYDEYTQREAKFELVWPKRMSHEEVKQLVAEREAKKEQK